MNNTKMHFKVNLIFILLLFVQTINSQTVWPGDVTNNGVVNKIDLLYLGYAFGAKGSPRTSINANWEAQASSTWDQNFPNGLNFAYADCNGDGTVDTLDVKVIEQNLDLVHNDVTFIADEILPGVEGTDAPCKFIDPPAIAKVGQPFKLNLGLGTDVLPLEKVHGMTFKIKVDPQITGSIGNENLQLNLQNDTWLNNDPNNSIKLVKSDVFNAEYQVAWTKTDQKGVSGNGTIIDFSYVIIVDIIELLQTDTITFTVDSITVVNEDLIPIPIVPDTLKIKIDRTVNTQETYLQNAVEVFPNPVGDLLMIHAPEVKIKKVEIFNALGQQVYTKAANASIKHINFQSFPPSSYWALIHTDQGVLTKQFQKL